jgi:hypothetical protein
MVSISSQAEAQRTPQLFKGQSSCTTEYRFFVCRPVSGRTDLALRWQPCGFPRSFVRYLPYPEYGISRIAIALVLLRIRFKLRGSNSTSNFLHCW